MLTYDCPSKLKMQLHKIWQEYMYTKLQNPQNYFLNSYNLNQIQFLSTETNFLYNKLLIIQYHTEIILEQEKFFTAHIIMLKNGLNNYIKFFNLKRAVASISLLYFKTTNLFSPLKITFLQSMNTINIFWQQYF